jgi:hypothetical protein
VKEKPELFNTGIADEDYPDEYSRAMTGRHFKFIISPESPRVDIPAAVHTDTDHPHAHLLINGKDRDGREARFEKLFITQTMREMVLTTSFISVTLNPRKDQRLYWPAALKNALLLIWREGTS